VITLAYLKLTVLEETPNGHNFILGAKEIWQYLKDVATKYDLDKYIKLNIKVESAKWDEENGVWRLLDSRGRHSFRRYQRDTC
jgi:cation diffusion facilitator CzcD-associated flavoprotein CzcO